MDNIANILNNPYNLIKIYLILNSLVIFGLFIAFLSTKRKIKKLTKKYTNFMNGSGDKNLEELIEFCIENSNDVKLKSVDFEKRLNNIEISLLKCVQKVGILRYNAFENVGSDLSFVIALLDSNDNGVIINGIFSRDNSSSYAKPIISGKSKYPLSVEEIQVIDIAKKSYDERLYT